MGKKTKYLTLGFGGLTAMSGAAMAEGTDILTSLQGSATTAVTAGLATIGVILLAGIAKPIAIKAYGIVRQVINKF